VNERDFDVVVFGATGVTGRQVAAYLAERTDGESFQSFARRKSDEELISIAGTQPVAVGSIA
jgi:short subunit dehydrogenase-like uncharacterized protein